MTVMLLVVYIAASFCVIDLHAGC